MFVIICRRLKRLRINKVLEKKIKETHEINYKVLAANHLISCFLKNLFKSNEVCLEKVDFLL